MTTVVSSKEEEELTLAVVRFVSELIFADAGAQVREAEELLVLGKWFELASRIVKFSYHIFSNVREKDLECIYAVVIFNLVTKLERPEEICAMAEHISWIMAQQPSDKPALRLKILFNLYNLLEDGYIRYHGYSKTFQFASSGRATCHYIPSFNKVGDFLKELNFVVQDQRELRITILNILKGSKSNGKDSFNFLTKYLATFSSEDAVSQAKVAAVQAICEFVKAPDMNMLLFEPLKCKERKHHQVFERQIRWKQSTRQPMPEEVPSQHRAAKEVKIRPSYRDMKSEMTLWSLYDIWSRRYNIFRPSIHSEEADRRFKIFMKNAIVVFEMNLMDTSCDYHLLSNCDQKDLFDMEEFFRFRDKLILPLCVKKKNDLVNNLDRDVKKIENKIKFLKAVRGGEISSPFTTELNDVVRKLSKLGYLSIPESDEEIADGPEEAMEYSRCFGGYGYLLMMPDVSFEETKLHELSDAKDKKQKELEEMKAMDPMSLWDKDQQLEVFRALWP